MPENTGRISGNFLSVYCGRPSQGSLGCERLGLKRRKENPGYTGEEEFNYFLSVVFPAEESTIFNRVIKDLNGLTEKAFLGALKYNYELMLMPGFPCKPVEKHCMGMYVGGEWYHLKAWEDIYKEKDVVGQLDVSLLQDRVLGSGTGNQRPQNR